MFWPSIFCKHVQLWANVNGLMVQSYKISHSKENGKWKGEGRTGRRGESLRKEVVEMFCFYKNSTFQATHSLALTSPVWQQPTSVTGYIFKLSWNDIMQQPNPCKYGSCRHQWNKIRFYTTQELLTQPVTWSERKGEDKSWALQMQHRFKQKSWVP